MLKALLSSWMVLAPAAMATAQNLVPNPSFEDTSNCHLPEGQYEFMLGLTRPWFSPTGGTPDVYTADLAVACGVDVVQEGLASAFDGLRYTGIYMYSNSTEGGSTREYLAVRLNEDLVSGQEYRLSLRVARSTFSRFAVDTFGVYFSSDSLHQGSAEALPVPPQVQFFTTGHFESMDWIEVIGHYTADGGERYMYVGAFEDDSMMDCTYDPFFGGVDLGYYNVDAVELVPVDVSIGDTFRPMTSAYIMDGGVFWPGHRQVDMEIFDLAGSRIVYHLGHGNADGGLELPRGLASSLYVVYLRDRDDLTVVKWIK